MGGRGRDGLVALPDFIRCGEVGFVVAVAGADDCGCCDSAAVMALVAACVGVGIW